MSGLADFGYEAVNEKKGGGTYGFITGEATGTACLRAGVCVSLAGERVGGVFKVTVFLFEDHRHFVVPLFTRFLRIVALSGGSTLEVEGQRLRSTGVSFEDVTRKVGKDLAEAHAACFAYAQARLLSLKLSPTAEARPFVHTYMSECELPLDPNPSWKVPCIAGWPQMNGLKNVAAGDIVGSFVTSVCLAKAIIGFIPGRVDLKNPKELSCALDTLFVCALRVYAGVYPDGPERIDDRSLGCLKLNTNSDCDDMCITSAAFFNRLMCDDVAIAVATTPPRVGVFSWAAVLSHGRAAFTEVWCVQGLVRSSVAVPGKDTTTGALWVEKAGGHVWCVLKRRDGTFAHLECTRCVAAAPRQGEDDPETDWFLRHPSIDDELGLAAAELGRYKTACAVYSATATMVPHLRGEGSVGVSYEDFFCGRAVVTPLVCDPPAAGVNAHVVERMQRAVDTTLVMLNGLRHCPSYAAIRQAVDACPGWFVAGHLPTVCDSKIVGPKEGVAYGHVGAGSTCQYTIAPCCAWAGHAVDLGQEP